MVAVLPEVEPLRRASRQVVRELGLVDQDAACAGVTLAQGHALVELASGARTAGELAEALNLDKSTVSRTVAGLLRRGWIRAGGGGADRRKKPLALTARGRRRLRAIHAHASAQVQDALGTLAEEERQAVLRGMEIYAAALARRRTARELVIRPARPADDAAVARVLRTVMAELGAAGPGTAAEDGEVDAMSRAYRGRRARYLVLERRGRVLGGAGFGPLKGAAADVCELRKMYLLPEARGQGMGRELLARVLVAARRAGYRTCYLETRRSMVQARRLYEKAGFRPGRPRGATGHFACDAWYERPLDGLDNDSIFPIK